MTVLVTGAAGFIGRHLCERLLREGREVVGVDDLNPYYDPNLKHARLIGLQASPNFRFERLDIADAERFQRLAGTIRPNVIAHLAAQAGVRASISNPFAYAHSNLNGHLSVLQAARNVESVRRLVYASSSSVYGASTRLPFREDDPCDSPVSLYAATKRADELMSESYARLYGKEHVGLRFFTVYGPMGRPDMAYWTFAEAILEGRPIRLFNHGAMRRDFTYVDDAIEAVVRVLDSDLIFGPTPHRLLNVGAGAPMDLEAFVRAIEKAAGRPAVVERAPMQPGDMVETFADVQALRDAVGYAPKTPMTDGAAHFVAWLRGWREARGAA